MGNVALGLAGSRLLIFGIRLLFITELDNNLKAD